MHQKLHTLRDMNAPRIMHTLKVACAHSRAAMLYVPGSSMPWCMRARGIASMCVLTPKEGAHIPRAAHAPEAARAQVHASQSCTRAQGCASLMRSKALLRVQSLLSQFRMVYCNISRHNTPITEGFEGTVTFQKTIKGHLCCNTQNFVLLVFFF